LRQLWVAHEVPPSPVPLWRGERYRHDRIRLAYVSADFNNSAVSTLMAGVFEHHDRSRFETVAVAFGPAEKTPMRMRLESAFEHFLDLRTQSDLDIAARLRAMESDIAVDLMGVHGECRSQIFAERPAPLQVNYLGFPGTMGAPYIDYIVADSVVIPEDHQRSYAEKIAHLPDCYLPSDSTRPIAAHPSRREAGLPEQGFVFASFTTATNLPRPSSTSGCACSARSKTAWLWLPHNNALAMRNLAREAELRGVAAKRLVFAPPIAAADEHLARLSLADLFLDTLPYNAHTSAIDALWAGVPLLTLLGNSFAGRAAASALNAAGLPDLIAHSPAGYEALALSLARNSAALAGLRAKLARNRLGSSCSTPHNSPDTWKRLSRPCGRDISGANRQRVLLSHARVNCASIVFTMNDHICRTPGGCTRREISPRRRASITRCCG